MNKYRKICRFVLISSTIHSLSAQATVSFDTIAHYMTEQSRIYPKEKLHVHIDHSCYFPGDTLWFKVYMVDAPSHISIRLSRYVYVELVNSENETAGRAKVRPDDMSQFHGYISLPKGLPGGRYALLTCTRYILSEKDQLVFKREVCTVVASNQETTHLKACSKASSYEENMELQLQLWNNRQE